MRVEAGINDVTIGGNHINTAQYSIFCGGGTNVKILPNTLSSPVNVYTATGVNVLTQTWLAAVNVVNGDAGASIIKSDTRQLPTLSSTATLIAQIGLSAYRQADVVLTFEGLLQGVGTFYYRLNRSYLFTSGTATVTTNGTEYGPGAGQGAAASAVLMTVSDNGAGLISFYLTCGGANAISGTSTANVNGALKNYYRN